MTDRLRVTWTNPVTGIERVREFDSREKAERYVEGRERKYGAFEGYQPPVVEVGDD